MLTARKRDPELQRVARRLVAEALGLLHLTVYNIDITLATKPDGDGCAAKIDVGSPYLHAHVRIYPHFWNLSEEERRHAIVHELAHIIAQPSKDCAARLWNGKPVTWDQILDTNETLCDWIARVAIGRTNER